MSGIRKIIDKATKRNSKRLESESPARSPRSSSVSRANGTPRASSVSRANGHPRSSSVARAESVPVETPQSDTPVSPTISAEQQRREEISNIPKAQRPGGEKRLSFTEQKIMRKEDKEEENEAQAAARDQRKQKAHDEDPLREKYGDLPMNMSQERIERNLIKLPQLTQTHKAGDEITFRARVHHLRAVGPKIVFIIFRQKVATIQGILTEEEGHVSENMVRWAEGISREAIVIVSGTLKTPPPNQGQVKSTTVHELELSIHTLHVVAHPTAHLPFQIEDASRPASDFEGENSFVRVGEHTRLNNRVLDLRAPAAQAIFRIHAGICKFFRDYLNAQDFTEIQSSKFQEATAESGAAVFKVDYFRRPVFLAQSPQLAKQMCIAADMERVYEIGPVFRAENSNTHRHLTEFIGLDMEMAFESHYHEVIDVIDGMFLTIFKGLQEQFRQEIETVKRSYPHDDLVFLDKTLRLKFADAVKLLNDSGWRDEEGKEADPMEDLSTKAEVALGRVIKEQYHTDYYIIDKFPASARPFYTMPDPENDKITNSYDFFLRGEEILSGGQRIHDAPMLEKRMEENGLSPDTMKEYLDGFRWGCPPHGGGGIGLERVVFLFLKLGNVRWASLFPRDPRSFLKNGQDTAEAAAAAAAATILHGPEAATFKPGLGRGELPPLENLIAKYGDATNTSWVDPAWSVWRDGTTGAAVGYVPTNGFAVTFGNPLCDIKQIPQVVDAYLKFLSEEKSLKVVWCCIDKDTEKYLAEKLGWSALIAVAEERINPTEVDVESDKNVRHKIHRAEREGVKITEVEGEMEEQLKQEIEQRCKDWSDNRKGTQVHLTGVRPFDDMTHRRYFYARDKEGKMCAMVVLAQLSVAHGFQIKWALEFPKAPLGAIEYILAHVIKKLGDAGVRQATFGAGATGDFQRVENVGGFRVRTLEKTYNGISHTFNLTNKGDFRSKFGTYHDPLYICYPKGGLGVKGIQAIMNMLQMPK